jgi:hypothetical protein
MNLRGQEVPAVATQQTRHVRERAGCEGNTYKERRPENASQVRARDCISVKNCPPADLFLVQGSLSISGIYTIPTRCRPLLPQNAQFSFTHSCGRMDLQTLSNLFATTYNPDPNVRKAAELQIRKVSSVSSLLSMDFSCPLYLGQVLEAVWDRTESR